MSRISTRIFNNLLSGWLSLIVRAGVALVMVPFLLRQIGQEGYGLIALLGVITSMALMADLGLRGALGREMTEHLVRDNAVEFQRLASTALVIYLLIGSVLSGLCIFGAPQLAIWFRVPDGLFVDAVRLIRIYGGVAILTSFITPVFSAALSSSNRFDIINSTRVATGLISNVILFVVLYYSSRGLYAWVAVMLAGELLFLGCLARSAHRVCPAFQLSPRQARLSYLKPLFQLGGYMYAMQMAQTIAERSNPLVLSYFFGPAGVALYSPGERVSQIVRPIAGMLSDQLYPVTTRDHVEGNALRQKRVLCDGTKYIVLLGSLFSIGIMVFAEPFCRLWLGGVLGDAYRTAAWVMMGWAAADFIAYTGGTGWPIVLAMRRLGFVTLVQTGTAVLHILLSIWLVSRTSLGIPGVMLAAVIVGLIRRPIFVIVITRWCGIPVRDFMKEVFAGAAWVVGLSLVGMLAIREGVPITGYLSLAGCAFLSALLWSALCWWIGFNERDRQLMRSLLKGMVAAWSRKRNGGGSS